MTSVRVLLAVLLVVAAPAMSMAQDQQVWVTVFIKGKAVMGFVPAENRAGISQRGVYSEVGEAGAKTRDGAPICGFRFTGWKDGDGFNVLIFAMVTSKEPGSQGRCGDGTGFKRVEFDELRIKSGEELTISKMKDAGMTPWVMKAGRQERMFQ